MSDGILVFAAKRVGKELFAYLVDIGAPLQRVVVATVADDDMLALATAEGVPAEVYSRDTQDRFISEGRRYWWLLNLWSPHILRAPLLALADHRLNVHPSLVPHCRGNDNAAWTIRKGLPAGVSLIEMGEEVDAGAVYAQREVPYGFPTTGKALHEQLRKEAVALFKASWPEIFAGHMAPRAQAGPATSYTRRATNRDRVLDAKTNESLEEFLRWALAHDFSPATTAEVVYQGRTYRLTVTLEDKPHGLDSED